MHNYAALTATGIPLTSGSPRAALLAEATVAPYNGRPVPIPTFELGSVFTCACNQILQLEEPVALVQPSPTVGGGA